MVGVDMLMDVVVEGSLWWRLWMWCKCSCLSFFGVVVWGI